MADAAHAWDVVGAPQAGCLAAFIARPGKVRYPLGPEPDIVAPDLETAAEQILAQDPAPLNARTERHGIVHRRNQ